jgi:hypothetical protein
MHQILDLESAPFCSKRQAASCYVARLAIWHDLEARSTAHCFLSIVAGATGRFFASVAAVPHL